MRIECGSLDEFLEELESDSSCVHRRIVRIRIDETPEQKEPPYVTFMVGMWATALMQYPDGQAVLEFGGACGSDDENGHEVAGEWKSKIVSVCTRKGLTVRGGKVEVF